MIQKNYEDGKRHVHVLSFGAGTQSTALLLMALNGEINGVIPDFIIFSDTGWESDRVYEWLHHINDHIKLVDGKEIILASAGNIRNDTLDPSRSRFASIPFYIKNETGGSEGMARRQCTREYKIDPVNKKIRELLGYKPRQRVKEVVHLWKGISTDEIRRVKPSRVSWQIAEHPLVDIVGADRNDCIEYVKRINLGTPPKSSCIGCPYHDNQYWADMKANYPDEFEDAAQFEDYIRTGLPRFKGKAYLHRSCIPLREIDFSMYGREEDAFDNECEGMCGL
ncbi:hypothetical protein D478_14860 [Brevibacillus agri BAB-2500]|nr:hypothetical protein D478_14860 [Brevibacillus agri BAB-2500]